MMKNCLLLVLLSALVGFAHADWVRVDHASTDINLYVDMDTRQSSGHGSKVMWHLVDFSTVQNFSGKPFRSIKGQDEYDCDQGVRRDIFHLWHKDSMGSSQMVNAAYIPGAWTVPAPGSVEQTLMRLVCANP
jgi:hypothetical protein